MEKEEKEEKKQDQIEKTGEVDVKSESGKNKIHVMTIIGEIEGHDNLSANNKTTKYEHVLPKLASLQEDEECEGLLLIINTVGGDVSAGLALAEMVASLTKPKVSLVIGDCHSIGVPLAVSCDYSFIVPTGTMVVHPVRVNGMVIGAPQTFTYFKDVQNRITSFVCSHCGIAKERFEELMMETEILTKDMGTVLEGKEAVGEGIINEIGGISQAIAKLHELIDVKKG